MMLTFEEKKNLFDTFEELTAVPVSLNRLNYHYEQSAVAKTVVVRNLHPNGHAMIYAGYLPKEQTQKGYLSVFEEDEATLRKYVEDAIAFLNKTEDGYEIGYSETFSDTDSNELVMQYEGNVWTVEIPGGSIEAIFKTKEAAEAYLREEGFSNQNGMNAE